MDHISIYRKLRAEGLSESEAVKALISVHGASFDAAVDAAWMAAKGKAAPKPGSLVAIKHDRAAEAILFKGE